jgi:putative transposase
MGWHADQNGDVVPHAHFIEMLTYKAALVGIQVRSTEASDTSKASFLDADPLPIFDPTQPAPILSGRRVKWGLYQAADDRHINADANGSYTIMRTVAPAAFAHRSSVCVSSPHTARRMNLSLVC